MNCTNYKMYFFILLISKILAGVQSKKEGKDQNTDMAVRQRQTRITNKIQARSTAL